MPLSLTLLSAAVAPERRNAALGIWGAIGGAAVAIGPLVGGAVTTGWSWQYIFWLNVPVGIVLIPLAWWKLSESRGRTSPLDLVGVGLVSAGLFGVVFGLVRGNAHGWTSPSVLGSFVVGAVALAGFIAWELRSDHPMLDIRLFRNRGFTAVNVTALLFSFGMFGSIFFLTQFLQTVQGLSPLAAGIRVLPWTAMVMVLAPVVGLLAERWGGKPLVVTGLAFQTVGLTWLATITTPSTPYTDLVVPFVICGIGMTLFFVPLASLVLGAVPTSLEGVASGANSAFRELGGVLGIAALGAVFSAHGGYRSGEDYVNGLTPAVYAGAVVVAIGAVAALAIPGRRRARARQVEPSAALVVDQLPVGVPMPEPDAGNRPEYLPAGRRSARRRSRRARRSQSGVIRGARTNAARRMSVAWGRSSERGRLRCTRTPRSTWAMVPTPKRVATSIRSASSTAYPSARPHFSRTERGAAVSPAKGCSMAARCGKSRSMIGLAISSVTRPPPSGAPWSGRR